MRDNDTSVAEKALPAEYPGEVRFLWNRLVIGRLMTSHAEHSSVTPGCRGQVGVLRAKGKTVDYPSHRSPYGGSDTYLLISVRRNYRGVDI